MKVAGVFSSPHTVLRIKAPAALAGLPPPLRAILPSVFCEAFNQTNGEAFNFQWVETFIMKPSIKISETFCHPVNAT